MFKLAISYLNMWKHDNPARVKLKIHIDSLRDIKSVYYVVDIYNIYHLFHIHNIKYLF